MAAEAAAQQRLQRLVGHVAASFEGACSSSCRPLAVSAKAPTYPKHVLTFQAFSKDEVLDIMKVAFAMKKSRKTFLQTGYDRFSKVLEGYSLLTLFEKPSLRTRNSLEVGMHQMGGQAIFYSTADSPLGKKESFEDTAKVLSRMVQGVTGRVNTREQLRRLAENATIPIINALDDYGHPMQMFADLQTIIEHRGTWEGMAMAYFGDLENNVTYDLMRMAAVMGYEFRMAGVGKIEDSVWAECKAIRPDCKIRVCETAVEAMTGVDAVYCDSWMSYGIPKAEEDERIKLFMPYQVTADLMKKAKPDCIFMNCLPAARGMEQTAEVVDGPQSVVFDQAENRLHAQKAMLVYILAPHRFRELVAVEELPTKPILGKKAA
eukprot:TRINITY_DN23516_c0_g1_i1.p1 TRINITY_DN23516_c0_g1~~TRINITY_DN23516_c0_g1_i1.p1  ORF type:complete len:376 (-),score=110.68 TRINITY_DN23516_c0_g1_i1:313-1440(-)